MRATRGGQDLNSSTSDHGSVLVRILSSHFFRMTDGHEDAAEDCTVERRERGQHKIQHDWTLVRNCCASPKNAARCGDLITPRR